MHPSPRPVPVSSRIPVPGYHGCWCVGKKQHRTIAVKRLLRAVAMMHVPIHDQHLPDLVIMLGIPRRDRHDD